MSDIPPAFESIGDLAEKLLEIDATPVDITLAQLLYEQTMLTRELIKVLSK
jgi:hypothetical protein